MNSLAANPFSSTKDDLAIENPSGTAKNKSTKSEGSKSPFQAILENSSSQETQQTGHARGKRKAETEAEAEAEALDDNGTLHAHEFNPETSTKYSDIDTQLVFMVKFNEPSDSSSNLTKSTESTERFDSELFSTDVPIGHELSSRVVNGPIHDTGEHLNFSGQPLGEHCSTSYAPIASISPVDKIHDIQLESTSPKQNIVPLAPQLVQQGQLNQVQDATIIQHEAKGLKNLSSQLNSPELDQPKQTHTSTSDTEATLRFSQLKLPESPLQTRNKTAINSHGSVQTEHKHWTNSGQAPPGKPIFHEMQNHSFVYSQIDSQATTVNPAVLEPPQIVVQPNVLKDSSVVADRDSRLITASKLREESFSQISSSQQVRTQPTQIDSDTHFDSPSPTVENSVSRDTPVLGTLAQTFNVPSSFDPSAAILPGDMNTEQGRLGNEATLLRTTTPSNQLSGTSSIDYFDYMPFSAVREVIDQAFQSLRPINQSTAELSINIPELGPLNLRFATTESGFSVELQTGDQSLAEQINRESTQFSKLFRLDGKAIEMHASLIAEAEDGAMPESSKDDSQPSSNRERGEEQLGQHQHSQQSFPFEPSMNISEETSHKAHSHTSNNRHAVSLVDEVA